ncbi:MAG TPA: hypothetical protein VN999_15060, partial [Thermoanaerobaculia bacterium]|nr:hypothetical protein [Thermoanaerobaculia bacterium]
HAGVQPYYYAGPGTLFWLDASSAATYGRLWIDGGKDVNGNEQVGPVTTLPALGSGSIAAWTAAGANALMAATTALPQPWLGAWVAVLNAGGSIFGEFQVLQIDSQGRLLLSGAGAVTGAASYQGEYRFDRIDVQDSAGLSAADTIKTADFEVSGAAPRVPAQFTAGSMTVKSGAVATPVGGVLRATVTGQLNVQAGARIDLTAAGYAGASGTTNYLPGAAPAGVTPAGANAGGSHGGASFVWGGFSGQPGATFDSVYVPQQGGGGGSSLYWGSGRRGGNGGGIVDLTLGSLQLDGAIWAKGESRPQPANGEASGAGGTVILHVGGAVAGAGTIDASGGLYDATNYSSSPGAGGRVAIYAGSFQGFSPATQAKAQGGQLLHASAPPYSYAGPGTVFWLDASSATYGRLLVDSGLGAAYSHTLPITLLPGIGAATVGTATPDSVVPANLWIKASSGVAFQLGLAGMWVRDNGVDYPVLAQSADLKSLELGGAAASVNSGDSILGIYKFDEADVRGAARLQFNDVNVVGTFSIDSNSAVIQNHP